jgi:uncharacterized membrane protein YccC
MRPSTKHALLQRFVALIGVVVAIASNWIQLPSIEDNRGWILLLGFVLAFIGVFSGRGYGPWGRHLKKLHDNERRAEIGRTSLS